MADAALGALRVTCAAIVEGGATFFRWEWDDYVGAALAPFPTRDAPAVHALLSKHFAQRWHPETIAGASAAIRALAESFGGLRTGQELFASEPNDGVTLFGCWWPWGNGERVSIRIGLAGAEASDADQGRLREVLRRWFAL
jgi:hypothetical protein